MLKFKVQTLDEVAEADRAHYTEIADGGGFALAVEGIDDPVALKGALVKERADRKEAKERVESLLAELTQTKEAARLASQENARNSTDVRALEEGWAKKHAEAIAAKESAIAAAEAQYKPQVTKLRGTLEKLLVDNEAIRIASAIAMRGCASLLLPHIRQRLAVAERDGELVTVVNDKAGKPTNMSLADFQSQFSREVEFAPIIAGSRASGGGAGGDSGRGSPTAKTMTRAQYDALPLSQRDAYVARGGRVE